MNTINSLIDVQAVLAGQTDALDFTGDDVTLFCGENGLKLIAREEKLLTDDNLVNIVIDTFETNFELS